jgi:hypothetical protein
MPRASKNHPKVDDDAVYVAIESFAAEVAELGHEITIQRGQRLRGSNPVVKERPYYFVADGSAAEDVHAARIALTPTATEPSESVERRKRNSVTQLRQAVLDRAEFQLRLEQADEYIATCKRKAEAEGAPKREIEKALQAELDPNRGGRWRGLRAGA